MGGPRDVTGAGRPRPVAFASLAEAFVPTLKIKNPPLPADAGNGGNRREMGSLAPRAFILDVLCAVGESDWAVWWYAGRCRRQA
jgi:hypothetical protein